MELLGNILMVLVIGLVVMVYTKLLIGWIAEQKKKDNQEAVKVIGDIVREFPKVMGDIYDTLLKKEEEKKAKKAELEPMPWDN